MIDLELQAVPGVGWADLQDDPGRAQRTVKTKATLKLTVFENGSYDGKPSVAYRFDMEDGRIIVGETTLTALLCAVEEIVACYGDPR